MLTAGQEKHDNPAAGKRTGLTDYATTFRRIPIHQLDKRATDASRLSTIVKSLAYVHLREVLLAYMRH